MNRTLIVIVVATGLLAGCSPKQDDYGIAGQPGRKLMTLSGPIREAGDSAQPKTAKLAYTHDVTAQTREAEVAPRYERAKTRCATDATFECSITDASLEARQEELGAPTRATLSVRLAPRAVEPFIASVLEPLDGGKAGEASILGRTDRAEDLTDAITDLDRHLAQLTDYRERLTALVKRGDAKVEDLVKIEQALSETQGQIEALTAESKGLNRRVDTELVTISLRGAQDVDSVMSPIRRVFDDASEILGRNLANAIGFTIGVLPWIPLAIIGFFVVRFGWHRFRTVSR